MSRNLKRKTILLVLLAAISLVVMGVSLTLLQGRLSLASYREDMENELSQLSGLLEETAQEKAETIASDNAIYQSKAESIAFMAAHETGFAVTDAKMAEYAQLLEVDNVLIVDRQGNQLAKAAETAADFTYARYNQLKQVFETGEPSEPVELETENAWARYYSAPIDAETMVVVEQQPEELYSRLDTTVSQASILKNISVGLEGYIFSLSSQSYALEYHPNEELIGQDALTLGISVKELEDGNFSWLTLDGERMYCGVSLLDNTYYISAVPEKEIEGSRNITVGIILFIFFAVITIIITYGIFIMRAQEKSKSSDPAARPVGGLLYNAVVGRKAAALSFVGLLCVVVISFYMQTLFSLSNQSMSNTQRVNDVESTMRRYEEQSSSLTEQYNSWYLNKCRTAAYILERSPELASKEALAQLADVLQIKYIYVFDAEGSVTATNSTYNKFQLSQDPEDQSYAFRQLLIGGDYIIQEAQNDEVSGDLLQYIGVSLHDSQGDVNGFVQIAIRPSRLENLLQNMQLSNVLDGVQVSGGGFAFAVDKETRNFTYFPEDRLIGRSALAYGLQEGQLKDGYNDYLTIQSQQYYSASVETGDYYVYVAVPKDGMMKERIPLTLASGGISLAFILLIFLLLSFSPKRGPVPACGAASQKPQAAADRMIDVTLPSGRVKKTESAESRWMNLAMKWEEKTPEQQIASVVKWLFGILAVAICLAVLFQDSFFGEDSIFTYVISGKWEKGLNVFALTACIMIIGVVTTATELVKRLLRLMAATFGARGETICRMISSFLKYLAIIAMLYYCFALFGVDTATLLASAGILSIAISFGAKELVSDILSGLFIIFEGEFRVGDIVMIGSWRGTVLEIGVRTTKIEDGAKNIKIIRNSNVSDVINMTKRSSYASCDIGIEYGESLERVENIFEKEFPNIRRHLPAILDGPFYKGVVSLGDNSVNVRIVVQCNESDRIQLERDLNREMKLIFDKYDINIPFPQVVINQPVEFTKATEWEKQQAQRFADSQKKAAKELGNDEDDDDR